MKTILIVFGLCCFLQVSVSGLHDYPGAIEISGYGNRRGRSGNFDQIEDLQRIQTVSASEAASASASASAASRHRTKTQADIETVRQNIEKYNKLLKVDTRTLPESKKELLEKIVERVARLKESLDIADGKVTNQAAAATVKDGIDTTLPQQQQQQTTVSQATATDATTTISDSDINQETSSLADAIVDDFYSGTSTIINLSPSSTDVDDEDQAVARANNNNNLSSSSSTTIHKKTTASVSSSSTSTSSKSTRKPSSTKRHNQRPSSMAVSSTMSPLSTNQQKMSSSVTAASVAAAAAAASAGIDDSKSDQQFDQQQFNIQQRNPLGNNVAASAADPLYDSNVTTSAIIDSLSNTNGREDYYNSKLSSNKDKKPGTAKPTKYHYYPHNQHIYLLPECAIQQVCNAVYVRLNYTQPLCACPSRYRDPCSASLNEDDQHTTKLVGDSKKKAITLAKTCEATTEMRECRTPKDWSLLALQNTRTGKSHYLVICKCPEHYKMEGPMAHDQPTYASVPGIRVFGMMCVKPGYPIRKPSYQPPKRYQLQKPLYHASTSNKYGVTKDPSLVVSRPTYNRVPSTNYGGQHHPQQDTFQNQHQANYQYLNRPDHSSNNNKFSNHHHSDSNSFNSFGGGAVYGRTKGQTEIDADEEGETTVFNTEPTTLPPQTTIASVIREKRSVSPFDDPPFPWDRLYEFEKTINWD